MPNAEIQLRYMIIIATRGLGNKITKLVKDYAHFQSILLGRGTASSEILSALGISEHEKDVVFCFIEKHNVPFVFKLLDDKFNFNENHTGIALTVPVSAVGGLSTFQILTGNGDEKR